MVIREVNYLKVEDMVRAAWDKDDKLAEFYDKKLKLKSLENMVYDTMCKIKDFCAYEPDTKFYGVTDVSEAMGFIVLSEKAGLLYSFGIARKYRKAAVLKHIFDFIKGVLGNNFYCILLSQNTRAIGWLKICGMVECESEQKEIVTLKYILCQ